MTIEEHIEGLRLSLVQQSWSCNTPVGMANKKHDEELLELLEELVVLREAYKLACENFVSEAKHHCYVIGISCTSQCKYYHLCGTAKNAEVILKECTERYLEMREEYKKKEDLNNE